MSTPTLSLSLTGSSAENPILKSRPPACCQPWPADPVHGRSHLTRQQLPDPLRDWCDGATSAARRQVFGDLHNSVINTSYESALAAATRLIAQGDDPVGPGLDMLGRRIWAGHEPEPAGVNLEVYDQLVQNRMNDIATPEAIVAAARQISMTTSVITTWAQTPHTQTARVSAGLSRGRALLASACQTDPAAQGRQTASTEKSPTASTGHRSASHKDFGTAELASLEFVKHAGDLVFYGDVGTGKTHLASALVAHACQQGIPARFFTTAALVSLLRRAKEADRLDSQLAAIGRNKLVVIDELGYLPIEPSRSTVAIPSHLRRLREAQPDPDHQPGIFQMGNSVRRRSHGRGNH